MNTTNEIVEILRTVAGRDRKQRPSGSSALKPNTWRGDVLRLEAGLSEAELRRAEEIYSFRFPPDLREVLLQVLPVDLPDVERCRFPNWREVPNDYVQGMMDWPFDMLIWDVERNRHRLPGWTEEPHPGEDLQAMTRASVEAAPRLIPIFAHRFLPATPCESGNPIFSMHGTDTIIYGAGLLDYFCNEFKADDPRTKKPLPKKIPFWSALVEDD